MWKNKDQRLPPAIDVDYATRTPYGYWRLNSKWVKVLLSISHSLYDGV